MKEDFRDLDFQIEFYEKILEEKPDFIDTLIALADAYTKRGLYQKGLQLDLRLSKLKKNDPIVYYNLACSYSLLEEIENSLKSLEKAIYLGYDDFGYMKKDPDLENVRKDKRFLSLSYGQRNKSCRKAEPTK